MIPIPVKSEMSEVRQTHGSHGRKARRAGLAGLVVLALGVAACGGSGSPSSSGSKPPAGTPKAGGTYTILANSAFGVADPAQNYTLEEWQLLIDTHDGLVAIPAGRAARRARRSCRTWPRQCPTLTDGGKTYLFHIRRGIKFSNGQVMKPSDFVRTFERQFTVPGPTSFYSGIVGASKCSTQGLRPVQGRGGR